MPVSLLEWRVRIGRFVRNPPVINKLDMIKNFLERWKLKKEKAAASQPSTGDQTHCELSEKEESNMAPCPTSTLTQTPSESTKKEKSEMEASPPSTEGETPCTCRWAEEEKTKVAFNSLRASAGKGKENMASNQTSAQDQAPRQSAKKGKSKMAASEPTTQGKTSCQSAKKGKLKMATSPASKQHQTPCQSAKKEKSKLAASPPPTQDITPYPSAKKGKLKMAASQSSTQDKTPCQSAKKGKSKMAGNSPPTKEQTPCESTKKGKSEMAASPPPTQDEKPCRWAKEEKSKLAASPPPTQDITLYPSAKKGRLKMAASQSCTQDKTPCQSAKKGKSKMAASPPPTQDEKPCRWAKEEKTKMALNPPCEPVNKGKEKMSSSQPYAQAHAPCKSARKGKSKMAASHPSAQDQIPCRSAKKRKSNMAGNPPSPQDTRPCESPRKGRSKMEASLLSTQDETTCESAKKYNSKMAASPPSTQDETPCRSAEEAKAKMVASPPCEAARKGKEKMVSSQPYDQGQTCELAKADKSKKAASPPPPQDQALRESSEKEDAKMAASAPSTPHQALYESAKIENSKNAASQPSAQVQTPCPSTERGNSRIGASPPSESTEKESNMIAGLISTQDQTQCESVKKDESKIAASPPSTPHQGQCESSKKEKSKGAVSPLSSEDETPCGSKKKEKLKMAACSLPSTQDQAPLESAKKEMSKMAASQPSSQICQLKSPSCPEKATLVWPFANTGSCVLFCIAQVLLMVLTLMVACFQWCKEQSRSSVFSQHENPAETSHPARMKVFGPISSCFSCGMCFCRSMIACTVHGFCHLYLPLILLMKSGDVETNPGPNTLESVVSDQEFLKLAQDIPSSYYMAVGVSLEIPYAYLKAILIEKANNYTDALLDVFMKWNAMQQPLNTNKREVLADKLQENDLGDLSERLRNGLLLRNITVVTRSDMSDLVKTYEEALESGKVRCNRSRIMVVGPAGIGKTSLIRRLTGQLFNPAERSTVGVEHNIVNKNVVTGWKHDNDTDKVAEVQDISPNALKTAHERQKALAQGLTQKRIISATSTANDISYSIWDFGGQVIYYITHPLFLSWRSLYIVVFPFHLDFNAEPPRTEEINIQGATPRIHRTILDLLHFWLMSIYIHAVPPRDRERFEPKILLVGTFRHEHSVTEEDVKYKISQIKKMVQGKPYAKQIHSEILQIDNASSSEKEVTYIQEQIDKLVKESAYMQEDLPIRWRTFSDKIRALKRDTLLLDEARRAMTDVRIIKDEEVELVLEFCHDTGDLVYHQGCELIVLNPQILNNFVSNIITVIDDEKLVGEFGDDWKTLIEKGILTRTLLEAVWESNKGKPDELKYLVDMMVKFDLMCKIPEDSLLKTDILQGCYFVPCCSRPELGEVQKPNKDNIDDEFEFIIDFYKFLPDGFIHRLYVRMALWSMIGSKIPYKPTFHCREMLFYIDELHRVVMTNTIEGDDAHRIKVLILRLKPKGVPENLDSCISLKRDFIAYLMYTLRDLKKTWARRISYSLGLACSRCQKKAKFSLIPLEAFVECQVSAHCGKCNGALYAGRVKQVLGNYLERIEHIERTKAFEEALKSGKVHCNRSRIMVVGPAGIGKTSLIRRLTGQEFNPKEKSTVGTEHNTVNKNLVSGWKLDNDTNKDLLAECMVLHEQSEEQKKSSNSSAQQSVASHSAPSDEANLSEAPKSSSEDSLEKRRNIEKHKSPVQNQQIALPSSTGRSVPDIHHNVLKHSSSSDHDSGGKQRTVIAERLTKKRITNATSTANNISYSIWDFGGQVIYYVTHPLFISWRSLYIVVFPFHLDFNAEPPRTEEINIQGATPRTHQTILDLLHFWLMSIYVHAVPPRDHDRFQPKILLVGTFRHEHGVTEEDVKSKEKQIKKMVRGKPYAKQVHNEILQIDNSSSSEKEVTYIQEQIDKLVKESAYMQEDLPIRWRTFSDEMRALKKDMVLFDEARKAMTDVGIIKGREVELVLEFYHDTGDLIYHQGCELIVLNPQILNNFVSNIITVVDDEKLEGELGDDWKTLTEKGILTKTLLEDVWESNEGKAGELQYLINMMVKFDLVCKIVPEDSKLKTDILQGCHFVPCCSRPELCEWQKPDKADKTDEFEFIIDFKKFLPDGFLHRLYVRMASWSMEGPKVPYKPTFHSREMLFYIDELHRVMMTNTIKGDDAHRIKVQIFRLKPHGTSERRDKCISLKRDFLTYLQDTLKDLKKTWARRISYSLRLACARCCEKHKKLTLLSLEAFLECKTAAFCGECFYPLDAERIKQVFESHHETSAANAGATGAGAALSPSGAAPAAGASSTAAAPQGAPLGAGQPGAGGPPGRNVDLNNQPLPSGWEMRFDQHGRPFYVDYNTQTTTWERPLPSEWTRRENPQGRIFYVDNTHTTAWQRPLHSQAAGGVDPSALLGPLLAGCVWKPARVTQYAYESRPDLEMDERLNELAKHMPDGKYASFCGKLGIAFNTSKSILEKHKNDYCKATRECLADWKNRTGDTLGHLKQILIDAGLNGLVCHLQLTA